MFKLGCHKDKTDLRDYLMRAYLPVVKIPNKVDYQPNMSAVRDQGDEGTCVAFAAVSGMKEYQEKIDYKKSISLSPRYLYNECKKIDKIDGEGTTIRVAMKLLKQKGSCREHYWPYKPHQSDKPKSGAVLDAKKFRLLAYARIINLDELRMSLANKGPCVIGVMVFSGMIKTKTGKTPMPEPHERPLGGHALCAVGYDDKAKLVKFKNSWSDKWGSKGYGFLPYQYIEKYMLDAWSAVDIDDPHPLTLAQIINYANALA